MVASMKITNEVKVWDPLVRIFHWALVASFLTAYLSAHDWFSVHIGAGYVITALVVFRLVWGVIGTEHARFRSFVRSPMIVLSHLKDFVTLSARRYIGHNPAGGAMVIALLISLTAIILTGMQLYAEADNAGPFAGLHLGQYIGLGADGGGKYFWEDLHVLFVNATLVLVFLHVSSVVIGSFAHRENLPRAMVTGKKAKDL